MRWIIAIVLCLFSYISFTQTDTINILSWNIYMRPRVIFHNNQVQRADSIVKTILLNDIDIIVFQEIFDPKARKIIVEGLNKKYPYIIGPGFKAFLKLSSGVMIFSKYEIRCDEMTYYKECEDADCWAKKGALFADIFINPTKQLHLIGTHMQAERGNLYNWIRKRQLNSIHKIAESNKIDNVPIVYAGDFNISYQDSLYADMLKIFKTNPNNIFSKIKHSLGKDNDLRVLADEMDEDLVDYILLDENNSNSQLVSTEIKRFTANLRKKRKDLSDHYAVISTIIY